MCLLSYQPWQYSCYWGERAREIWNQPSESCLQNLVQITQVALAVLAMLFTFSFEWLIVGFSLAYRWIYPLEIAPVEVAAGLNVVAAQRMIVLDAFHGVVDVHAPDGIPNERLIQQMSANPYANPPENLDHCVFFGDAMQYALQFLAPHSKAHYLDLFRNEGVSEEGEARIDIYNYSAGCLIAHYFCTCPFIPAVNLLYPRTIPGNVDLGDMGQQRTDRILRNIGLQSAIQRLYVDFQGLSRLDKALVLLRLIAPEKDWQITEAARDLIHRIQAQTLLMSQDQFFLRHVLSPVAAQPEIYFGP